MWEDVGEEGSVFEVIDDFSLLRRVGEGGMGVVFHARQLSTGRDVALKLLKEGVPDARFRQEIEVLARLDHPGLVRVIHAGEHRGRLYFAMEYVGGPNLAQRARERPFQVREAVALIASGASAVHHAHERQVLHRDLKPENLLLDPEGNVRVTDFGLARSLHKTTESLTMAGAQLGTPAYMAPEQVAGDRGEEGPSTDVYGLGATLYHLVTGVPPFRADTLEGLFQLILGVDPASPRILNPAVDRDLELVVMSCLEKEPGRRYGSAADLADELGRWLAGEPVRRRRLGPAGRLIKWCRRKPAIATLSLATSFAVLLGLGGVLWQWRQATLAKEKAQAAEREQSLQRQLAESNAAGRRVMSGILRVAIDRLLPLAKRGDSPEVLFGILEQAGESARAQLGDQPFLASEIYRMVGERFYHGGNPDAAARWLGKARDGLQDLGDREARIELAEVLMDLAGMPGLGDGQWVDQAREAQSILRQALPPGDPRHSRARMALAHQLSAAGQQQEAEYEARGALADVMALPAAERPPGFLSLAHQKLGDILLVQGRAVDASEASLRALEARKDFGSDNSHLLIHLEIGAARALMQAGRLDEAGRHAEAADELVGKYFGTSHSTSRAAYELRYELAERRGDRAEIKKLNQRGMEVAEKMASTRPQSLETALRWAELPLDHGAFNETRDLLLNWLRKPDLLKAGPESGWIAVGSAIAKHTPWHGPSDLRDAIQFFAQASRRNPASEEAWFQELAALAALTNRVEFGRRLAAATKALESAKTPKPYPRLARVGLLYPLGLPQAKALADLLPTKPGTHPFDEAWLGFGDALARYRLGDIQAAIPYASTVRSSAPSPPECRVGSLAILAMAESRAGQAAESHRHLAEAVELSTREDPWILRKASSQWADWVLARQLLREAREKP